LRLMAAACLSCLLVVSSSTAAPRHTEDTAHVPVPTNGDRAFLLWHDDNESGGWQDIGVYGYVLLDYDSPLAVRFRFISDAAYSDEDAVYDSDGGAFHIDDIQVFDYYGSHVYFFDDVEDGVGQCTSVVPQVAGDYWHLVEKRCSASRIRTAGGAVTMRTRRSSRPGSTTG